MTMAAELGLLSLTQLQFQKLAHQSQKNHSSSSWMWNPNPAQEDDDSWEVRAFEEDTGNIMGTTWPPRSYTCTFCRREFRSAQALGGHMNVHRRDRARLHHHQSTLPTNSSSSTTTTSTSSPSSTFIIPAQEFSADGTTGLCLLYQLPNPNNGVFAPATMNACPIESPSTLLSISPFPYHNFAGQNLNYRPVALASSVINPSHSYSTKLEPVSVASIDNSCSNKCKDNGNEEVDLELRLGHRSTSSSS